MAHESREHSAPRLLVLDRQPEPRTVPVIRPQQAVDPPAQAQRRVATVVIVVTVLLAVLLLLAGSPAGAFVSGLIAGSVGLARYFHTVATRPNRH